MQIYNKGIYNFSNIKNITDKQSESAPPKRDTLLKSYTEKLNKT